MNINVNNLDAKQIIIDIEGVIGVEESVQFQADTINARVSTYEKFRAEIEKIDTNQVENLRLNIRSMGGSVQDALLMHSLLVELREKITIETHCYGFSASAATIIAQAASPLKRFIAGSALYMIHNASMQFDGNSSQASSAADLLAKTDKQIAQIYAERSGLTPEHFEELMGRGNGQGEWLSSQEAVELGLADEIENAVSIKKVMNNIADFFRRIFNPELHNNALQNLINPTVEDDTQNTEEFDVIAQETKTLTAKKEDPAIEHYSVQLSGNTSSYSRDVELFRGR